MRVGGLSGKERKGEARGGDYLFGVLSIHLRGFEVFLECQP